MPCRDEPHHEKVHFSQYLSHFLKITHLDAHQKVVYNV